MAVNVFFRGRGQRFKLEKYYSSCHQKYMDPIIRYRGTKNSIVFFTLTKYIDGNLRIVTDRKPENPPDNTF